MRATTTIIDRRKRVARYLYEGSQLPKVYNGVIRALTDFHGQHKCHSVDGTCGL